VPAPAAAAAVPVAVHVVVRAVTAVPVVVMVAVPVVVGAMVVPVLVRLVAASAAAPSGTVPVVLVLIDVPGARLAPGPRPAPRRAPPLRAVLGVPPPGAGPRPARRAVPRPARAPLVAAVVPPPARAAPPFVVLSAVRGRPRRALRRLGRRTPARAVSPAGVRAVVDGSQPAAVVPAGMRAGEAVAVRPPPPLPRGRGHGDQGRPVARHGVLPRARGEGVGRAVEVPEVPRRAVADPARGEAAVGRGRQLVARRAVQGPPAPPGEGAGRPGPAVGPVVTVLSARRRAGDRRGERPAAALHRDDGAAHHRGHLFFERFRGRRFCGGGSRRSRRASEGWLFPPRPCLHGGGTKPGK